MNRENQQPRAESPEWGTPAQAAELVGSGELVARLLGWRLLATRVVDGRLEVRISDLRPMSDAEVARIAEEIGL